MSGIAAIVSTDGAPADRARLAAMLGAMDFPGSGPPAIWADGQVALGHCRGAPLVSADGMWVLVFDGYLQNRDALCRELRGRGHNLRDDGDAAVALAALAQWGDGAPAQLEGEFALIAWHRRDRRLLSARDHQGLRPLAWHRDGKRFAVASEIAAVLAGLDETPPPNFGYLAEHLANAWYTNDETAWEGVNRLPGAHWMALDTATGALQSREYWQVPLEVTIRYPRDADYVAHYRELLDDVVVRTARSDRPVACEVSGGLDSSAVFCLLDRAEREGRLRAPGLKGYALLGPAGDYSDEAAFIAAVAAETGRQIAAAELFRPDLDWFVQQAREDRTLPFPPNSAMFARVQQSMAADGCGVCLNGQGGDQWLNGNQRFYRESLLAGDFGGLARAMRAERAASGLGGALWALLRHGLAPLAPGALKAAWRGLHPAPLDPLAQNQWLAPPLRGLLDERRQAYLARLAAVPEAQRYKLQMVQDPYAGLAYEMMHLQGARRGIECRSPLLSRAFIEFSAQTPEHIRYRGGTRKFVHREAMRGLLPKAVRSRTGKAVFDVTFQRLHPAMEAFCRDEARLAPFSQCVDWPAAEALFARYGAADVFDGAIWELWGVFSAAAFGRMSHSPALAAG